MSVAKIGLWLILGVMLITDVGSASDLSSKPVGGREPERSWNIPFDGSASAPVVHDGVLYLGSGDGALYAMDPENGRVHWRFQTGKGLRRSNVITVPAGASLGNMVSAGLTAVQKGKPRIEAAPVVIGDKVIFASEDRNLYAVNAKTGVQVWSVPLHHSGRGIVADSVRVYAASPDGFVYAFDAVSGAERWSFQTQPGVGDPRGPSVPVLAGDTLFVSVWPVFQTNGGDRAWLYAIDVASGQKRWAVALPKTSTKPPVVAGGAVLLVQHENSELAALFGQGRLGDSPQEKGNHASLRAYEPKTGELLWRVALPVIYQSTTPQFVDDSVLWGTDIAVARFDMATGTVRWQRSLKRKKEQHLNGFKVVGDTAYWAVQHAKGLGSKAMVYALDLQTGADRWVFRCGGYLTFCNPSPMAIANDLLLLAGNIKNKTKGITALRLRDGKQVWQLDTGTLPSAPPALWQGHVIIPSATIDYYREESKVGYLRAVNISRGR